MNRLALLLAVPVALALTPLSAAEPKSPQPNIIVFISDDYSQLDSQVYGSTEVRSPHMVRLAAEGMKFTHAFVASPACGPSRTALGTASGLTAIVAASTSTNPVGDTPIHMGDPVAFEHDGEYYLIGPTRSPQP